MENFLYNHVFLHLDIKGEDKFFLCAYVSNIDDTHITIIDKTKTKNSQESLSYRRIDIVEIKLSNREPNQKVGENEN